MASPSPSPPPLNLELPPGFRFHPTDEELVMHYLCKKCTSQSISVPIIKDIHLYKYDPWQLPELSLYGEKEWYFFTPRDRKYPNGSRPNRTAGSGYWKATGADKLIGKPKTVGVKKALVFYTGKAPKGEKTNWIMHEYRLAHVDRSPTKINTSLRLDDWVLCRIYKKKGTTNNINENHHQQQQQQQEEEEEDIKPVIMTSSSIPVTTSPMVYNVDDYFMYLNASESTFPWPHTADSPMEVQSAPKMFDWDNNNFFPYNHQISHHFQPNYQSKPNVDYVNPY